MQESLALELTIAPCQLYASSFLADLVRVGTLSGNGTIPTVIRLQDACTKIGIWRCSFAGLGREACGTSDLRHRLGGMWRCMEAVKTYMEIYMDLPVED